MGGEGLHELNLGWGGVNATSSPSVFPLWLRLGSFWTEDSHPGTGRDPLLPALRPRQGHPPTVGCRRFVSPPSVPEAFLSPQWGLRGLDGGGVDPAPGLAGSRDGGRGSGVRGPGEGGGVGGVFRLASPPPPHVLAGQVHQSANAPLRQHWSDALVRGVGGRPGPRFPLCLPGRPLSCPSPGRRLSPGVGQWVRGPRKPRTRPRSLSSVQGPGEPRAPPPARGRWSLGPGFSHLAVAPRQGVGGGGEGPKGLTLSGGAPSPALPGLILVFN